MHIDEWLKRVHEEEMLKQASLEGTFDQMDPEDLLEIATGNSTVEKVLTKTAAKMTQERREDLPSKAFAVPESKAEKIGVEGEIKGEAKGKYPIPDEKHAKNALARVSQHGTPAEREAVRKKVYAKYPQLREGFEERHGGESPTAKEHVKKVEQGGIGKAAQVKLAFVDKVARDLARTHYEVMKIAKKGVKPGEKYKTEGKKRKVEVLDKYYRLRQGLGEHKGIRTGVGAISGAVAGRRAAMRLGKGTVPGMLIGAGLGAGLGRISAHFTKRHRQAISGMGERPAWHGQSEKKAQLGEGEGMTSFSAFTTPEAQAKAKTMQRAMKMAKGAPTQVRKGAVAAAGNELAKPGA
jgi:hypothetical protein